MPTLTPKLGLKKPLGNETVSREAYNENLDLIDQNVAKKCVVDSQKEVLINSTSLVTIASYTSSSNGNFLIGTYLRVLNANSITVQVEYLDKTGAQTSMVLNSQPTPLGSYSLLPLFINTEPGSIVVKAAAGTANQVYASASILEV